MAGRKAIQVDKQTLEKVVADLESARKFDSLSELYRAVSDTDWGKQIKLQPQVAMLRMKAFGIVPKTGPGRLGKKGKKKNNAANVSLLNESDQTASPAAPEKFQRLALKACSSPTKAIKLKCLDCSNYQKKEVKNCPVTNCPLWAFRPYQGE